MLLLSVLAMLDLRQPATLPRVVHFVVPIIQGDTDDSQGALFSSSKPVIELEAAPILSKRMVSEILSHRAEAY